MSQISKETLKELEYFFSLSTQGHHFLFDKKVLTEILRKPTVEKDFFTFENLDRVQALFSDFVSQSPSERQSFLEKLPEETYELLVRTYFNIVENAVLEANPEKH